MAFWNRLSGKSNDESKKSAYQAQIEYTEKRKSELIATSGGINTLYAVSELPDQYNDCQFEGSRVVDGKLCNTVGEYKEACAKFYGNC